MAVKIGHAYLDERGQIKNGKPGDNTGKEVLISNYYVHKKGWVVLRCKDPAKRERIARAMEKACANNDIGYDQWNRYTLYNNVKDKDFDPSKTTKKVSVDCSELVHVSISYAYGKDITGQFRTVNEPSVLVKTGKFTKYTSAKYCKSSDYLKRGDILCTPVSGHTVVVLTDGAKVKPEKAETTEAVKNPKLDSAKKKSKSLTGTYKTSTMLNIRYGAGVNKDIIITVPKGTKLQNFGYYNTAHGAKWLLVQGTYRGVKFTGFCSKSYLIKLK